MKMKLLVMMVLFLAVLLGACTGITGNNVDISAIQDKLDKLDEYKSSQPAVQSSQQDNSLADDTFLRFRFGTTMDIVKSFETLTLSESYTDALDYTGSGIYGYDMLLTYWFNMAEQLYSISYSMENDEYFDTVDSLMTKLLGDYGEPPESGYYDSADNAMTFTTNAEAIQAVDQEGAYYYAAFVASNGINVELYARKIDTGYDYWVYYTDYSYYIE